MQSFLAILALAATAQANTVGSIAAHVESSAACTKRDLAMRVLFQHKLEALGVPCESMCKKMGTYPHCQCPGFAGMPASSDDNRACIAKHCADPKAPCPSDPFVTCVAANTKISALQWDQLFEELDKVQAPKPAKKHALALTAVQRCQARDVGVQALLQDKTRSLGVVCEEMCKEMGEYPNCQCPGFAGMPASADDNRACIVKYCADPEAPCPNDQFVTCVKENTAVSALQFDTVLEQIGQGVQAITKQIRAAKAKGMKEPSPSVTTTTTTSTVDMALVPDGLKPKAKPQPAAAGKQALFQQPSPSVTTTTTTSTVDMALVPDGLKPKAKPQPAAAGKQALFQQPSPSVTTTTTTSTVDMALVPDGLKPKAKPQPAAAGKQGKK